MMAIREPRRINIGGVTYRVDVEVTERVEYVERHTQLPDPSLEVERELNIKPVMDGLDITLKEKASYVDNDRKRFERGVKENWVGRNLFSRDEITSIIIHALQADNNLKRIPGRSQVSC